MSLVQSNYQMEFIVQSLAEYIQEHQKYYSYSHSQACASCTRMLEVGRTIHERGGCMLGKAFRYLSPGVEFC